MFDDLRAAFSEALDNFNKELSRNQVPETVDKLLVSMKNEIADETAQVAGVEAQLERPSARSSTCASGARRPGAERRWPARSTTRRPRPRGPVRRAPREPR